MLTVSIFSETKQQWREIQVPTMSEAVQLTLGLATMWHIASGLEQWLSPGKLANGASIPMDIEFRKQYQHALRSLVCRWVEKQAKQVVMNSFNRDCFRFDCRLTDSQLFNRLSKEVNSTSN